MNSTQWKQERTLIRNRLKKLTRSDLPSGAREDAWTGEQVLLHVLLTNKNILELLERLFAKANPEDEKESGKAWPVREDLESVVTERAFSVDAFKGTEPVIEVTEPELAELELRENVLVDLVEKADRFKCESIVFPHPLAGRMNFYEWFVFALWHERAHTQRLEQDLGLRA